MSIKARIPARNILTNYITIATLKYYVSGNVVVHSIAFRVASICWQGDDPFPL